MPICRDQVYQKRSIIRSKNVKVAWIPNNIQKVNLQNRINKKEIIRKNINSYSNEISISFMHFYSLTK